MAHIGIRSKTLHGLLDPLWVGRNGISPARCCRQQAIAIWESASGLKWDPAAFRWWQVFASVKAVAIWISSTEDFANGSTSRSSAMAGWVMTDRQNRILVDRLAPNSGHRFAEALV
jgi:hypothetical protein